MLNPDLHQDKFISASTGKFVDISGRDPETLKRVQGRQVQDDVVQRDIVPDYTFEF